MGYVTCFGTCAACHNPFSFNPNLVPSVRVNGVREPVCRSCVDRANPLRAEQGLPPIVVLDGAYEPCHESNLVGD